MAGRIEINTSQLGPQAFSVVVRELDEGALSVVAVTGELDLASAPDLKEMLDATLRLGGSVVVDLSAATFLDSTALNVLLRASRGLGDEGGYGRRLAIVCARPNVLRIFEFSGLDSAFAIFPALDDALANVREREACAG